MSAVVDRFLRYVQVNTQSELDVLPQPSTERQFDLARMLIKELESLGLEEIELTDHCYIYATLPANTDKKLPVIGLIAHMDTSPEAPGGPVHPRIIESYDGKDIILNEKDKIILSPLEFPEILEYVGQQIITTDGTTLLGADDKAGLAVIMTTVEYLKQHPQIKHGKIRIGFTPDEEVARGTENFDVKKFAADFAYTIDGGKLGELEYECFNAAEAKLKMNGRSVHPGSAKDQMINAIEWILKFHSLLPAAQKPEFTAGYEGFYHTYHIHGSVEEAEMTYIIRDHDREKFEQKKAYFKSCVALINQQLGSERLTLKLVEQYQNMKEVILPTMHVVDTAKEAMELVGVVPRIGPIRGGTDGARLSYQGLPTPNIFGGGLNFHGKLEYLPIPSIEKSLEVVIKIIELYGQR